MGNGNRGICGIVRWERPQAQHSCGVPGQGGWRWAVNKGQLHGGPVRRTANFDCKGTWVQSLVRELRSCKLHSMVKKKKGRSQSLILPVLYSREGNEIRAWLTGSHLRARRVPTSVYPPSSFYSIGRASLYCTLLYCTLQGLLFTNWRLMATLYPASLLAPFFQKHLFALVFHALHYYYYICYGDLWPVISDVCTRTCWSLGWYLAILFFFGDNLFFS